MKLLVICFLFGLLAIIRCNDEEDWACDPLVPEYCMLPFPNDFWMGDDGHLALANTTFPMDKNGKGVDPEAGGWNDLEGFSVFPAITTYWPGLDDLSIENCPRLWNMDLSMDVTNSPTVLLEAVTGEVVAHWVEVDHSSELKQKVDTKRAMLIWPSTSLKYGTRYIVGIKQTLPDNQGNLIKPSPSFAALRAGRLTRDERINSRIHHYENDIFPTLERAGVQREELLLAWDFTTNSKDDITRKMLSARDDARERLGEDGPKYRITEVTTDYNDDIYSRILGDFRMPMYLNTHLPTKDARMVYSFICSYI